MISVFLISWGGENKKGKQFEDSNVKSVIVALWHESGLVEVFSSLKGFLEYNPQYNINTLNNYISRKKIPYKTDELTLVRTKFIKRLTIEERGRVKSSRNNQF